MKRKTKIIIPIIIAILVLCGFYLHYENTKLQVSNHHITYDKIPDDFDNYKIVQISDFHNTKSKILSNNLIKEIDGQKPNIIVLTGDFIDSGRTDIDTAISFIKRINNIAPIYFVSGNHEASMSNYLELREQLEENQVIILDNKTEVLKIKEAEINLIGINDPRMAHEKVVSDSEIVKTELDNAQYDDSKYSILLSHRPELIDTYMERELDLVLAGHAHGGQIRIPFIGGIVAPNQGLFPEYTSGIFVKKHTLMIVSRGIGNSILPFRINNKPELVVITLHNK